MGGISPRAALASDIYGSVQKVPARDGFGHGLVELGAKDKNVVVLCADLTDSTRTGWFKEKYPERFIECGIAEQNMMAVAAGLSIEGKIPYLSTYAVFCPGRTWDQLRVSVCYDKRNVKLSGAHAGISVGPDGATHQALEDIAITRCLPNLTVLAPCDWLEAKKATIAAHSHAGPVYIRFGREKVPTITTEKTPFKIGRAEIFRDGEDVCVIACGSLVYEALVAAKELEKDGIDAMVINSHSVKPIDAKTISEAAKKTGCVVTAEEHQVTGGLGGAVAEVLAENYPVPMKRVGIPDKFGESGTPEELMAKYRLTSAGIIAAVKETVKRKGAMK